MTTTLRILILAIGATLFASCSDNTFGDDAESYEGLECWSEPDIKATPIPSPYNTTIPMVFRMGEKYSFKYRLFRPDGYEESTSKLPLIIYLHGLDQRGDDNLAQMDYAVCYFMCYPQYPAFAVYPQCPIDAYWALRKWPNNLNSSKMELNPRHC